MGDFKHVDEEIKQDESREAAFQEMKPEDSVYAFFEVLEGRQMQERRGQIERGELPDPNAKPPPKFSSAGKAHDVVHDIAVHEEVVKCDKCMGTGRYVGYVCQKCDGDGEVTLTKQKQGPN